MFPKECHHDLQMQNSPDKAYIARFLWILTLICLFISGCTYSAERRHPQFTSYRQAMKVMLVAAPEINIFERMPGGGRLFQDVRSAEAQRFTQHDIVRQLQTGGFIVHPMNAGMAEEYDIAELKALFRSVNHSIQLHTYGPQLYPHKMRAFEYELGSVENLLKAGGADGLVLTLGHQTGSGQEAKVWLSIAVIEPTGRIIWYGLQGGKADADLTSEAGIAALTARTLAQFREQGP